MPHGILDAQCNVVKAFWTHIGNDRSRDWGTLGDGDCTPKSAMSGWTARTAVIASGSTAPPCTRTATPHRANESMSRRAVAVDTWNNSWTSWTRHRTVPPQDFERAPASDCRQRGSR